MWNYGYVNNIKKVYKYAILIWYDGFKNNPDLYLIACSCGAAAWEPAHGRRQQLSQPQRVPVLPSRAGGNGNLV